jgi:hypothetical protein
MSGGQNGVLKPGLTICITSRIGEFCGRRASGTKSRCG